MTLVSSIILDAYRECNMLSLGAVPNEKQTTEALRLYNQLLAAIYGGDAGEMLTDWPLGNFDRNPEGCQLPFTDHRLMHPPINRQLIAVNEAPMTIWLTVRPQDGAMMGIADPFGRLADVPVTFEGNGRTIEGQPSIVLDTNGMFEVWFYRADLGDWTKISNVAETDENPFPAKYDIMWQILLAMRLSPRYGRSLAPETVAALKSNRTEFVNRYLQSLPLARDDSISWPFMSTQSYDTQRVFSSTSQFNRGDIRG